jgi:hypothetical protein
MVAWRLVVVGFRELYARGLCEVKPWCTTIIERD